MSEMSDSSDVPSRNSSKDALDTGGATQGTTNTEAKSDTKAASQQPPRVGFAVSKSVGGSVVRHRVSRKLRHVVAAHTSELPGGLHHGRSCIASRSYGHEC